MTAAAVQQNSSEASYLGIGLYSIPEAARLLRAPRRTVHDWAVGYSFVLDNKPKAADSLILPDYPELAAENILTFVDLIELHVIRMLRAHGVPMRTVKEAGRRLREKTGTHHPFALRGIETDARRIFHSDERGIEELGAYQYVFKSILHPFIKQLEYEETSGMARRLWPLGQGKIVLDPQRSFGKPIIYRGGVPTFPLYRMMLAGETIERIADWYEVAPQSVRDAIAYEESLAA